jgi:hypothetical protein
MVGYTQASYLNDEHISHVKRDPITRDPKYTDLLTKFHSVITYGGDIQDIPLEYLDRFVGYKKYTLFSFFRKIEQVRYFMERGYDVNKSVYINRREIDLGNQFVPGEVRPEDTIRVNQTFLFVLRGNFSCFRYVVDFVDTSDLKNMLRLLSDGSGSYWSTATNNGSTATTYEQGSTASHGSTATNNGSSTTWSHYKKYRNLLRSILVKKQLILNRLNIPVISKYIETFL